MNRRGFIAAACACSASLAARPLWAQGGWSSPARFSRPDIATDEGGLWAMMDRAETQLRRSPFVIRERTLRHYIQGIACRLGGDHCPDIRVHIVRTPLFNASMAPNGMMQVWTGLLLRMENEAQIAAVLGHEIGHYLQRHTLERLRDIRARSAFGQFLGLFGLAGAVGQLALLANAFGYSRDQEREADEIGMTLMRNAGYDAREVAKVWGNLLAERKAGPNADEDGGGVLFASHPGVAERQQTLAARATDAPPGESNRDTWRAKTRAFLHDWLADEVRRGQHEESIALLTRMIGESPNDAELIAARAEVYRLRAKDNDFEAALADFEAAIAAGGAPAEVYRGRGLIYKARNQSAEARNSFERYIELAPAAPDSIMIKSYIGEMGG